MRPYKIIPEKHSPEPLQIGRLLVFKGVLYGVELDRRGIDPSLSSNSSLSQCSP